MADRIDSQADYDDESESLRKMLEQMRKEAEAEVMRLSSRLAERDFAPDSSVATATERLAMQQEMVMLQQTLEAKEQALEHITEECRRLEDELEDQNIAYDGLKQELEHKEKALKEAYLEVDRLRQELQEAERLPEVSVVEAPALEPAAVTPAAKLPSSVLIAGGAVLFVLLSLVMVTILYSMWTRGTVSLPGLGAVSIEAPLDAAKPPPPLAAEPKQIPEILPQAASAAEQQTAQRPAVTASAPRVQRDQLRGGAVGPVMIALAGGVFEMGYNSLAGQDFSPAHSVDVPPFLIGAHEVTFEEYDRFARATGRALPNDYGWGRGRRPVVGVSWDDASAYAGWLSAQTNRRYRLPTEAEWEFAARGGTQSSFWWGYELLPGRAACFDCGSRWDNLSTAPVESFSANPFGLYDTAGNAMEWVADCYTPSYRGAPLDGAARLDGDCAMRVARGGAFNKPSASMRSFARAHLSAQSQLNMLGFRLARDA